MSDSTGAKRRVLSVGQCFADHSSIARVLRTAYGAEVVAAETPEEALDRLREGDFRLVLVNRVLDAVGTPGLEVIRAIKADELLCQLPVMLVSNYEDAQAEAVRE